MTFRADEQMAAEAKRVRELAGVQGDLESLFARIETVKIAGDRHDALALRRMRQELKSLEVREKELIIPGKQRKRTNHVTYCAFCDLLKAVDCRVDGLPCCFRCNPYKHFWSTAANWR